MANQNAKKDDNQVSSLLATSSSDTTATMQVYGDDATHALKVYVTGSATGGDSVNIAQVNGATVNVGTGAASTGTMRVTTSTDSTIGTLTGGGVASGAADSGNPVKVGGVYNTTQPTLTNGQRGDVQLDVRGNTNTNAGTLQAGEDQTNNVMRVEGQFSGTQCTADTQVKASAGFLHALIIQQTDAVPTAGTIIVYDNTAESGTIVATVEIFAVADVGTQTTYTILIDRIMTTGIYVGFTTTNDVSCAAIWR